MATTVVPTTVPPTTLVPTTTLTTPAPTTPPPHNFDADLTFDCATNNYFGVPIIEISLEGNSLNGTYIMDDLELSISVSISGEFPISATIVNSTMTIEVSLSGWAVANSNKKNWVAWSKIGNVSMELDLTNDAGRRPMSWTGYVYQVRQLDKNVVIYGSTGITLAFPVSAPAPTFGFKDLSKVGIKNKTAVGGDQFTHFFIDTLGCLYKLTSEGLNKLGYEEFLLPLTNPVLTWDADEDKLHISDEVAGYIFNEGTLTGGYANLTGLYRIKENLTGVSPETLEADPVEVVIDTLDLKRRGLKSIESIQFDAISNIPLQAAIDYRYKKKEEFKTTPWTSLNDEGVAHIRTAGVEFRIRLKGLIYGTFDLSYMSVQFKFIDQRFTRDPKGEIDVY